jgi:16S rRNA (guanine966-N2)-methyltransferase
MRKQIHQKSKASSAKGAIRIIAGMYRGRKLPVIMADGLRPTTDRVKETVFNWLMPYTQQSECLDCFAGAGSLGFEALSRGANHVTLLELNKAAATQLKQNKTLLAANNIDVINTDTLHYLKQPPTPYNLVFIDPPFRKALVDETIQLLNNGWLADNAMVYLEMGQEEPAAIPENWHLMKEKIAGQVAYRLYRTHHNVSESIHS